MCDSIHSIIHPMTDVISIAPIFIEVVNGFRCRPLVVVPAFNQRIYKNKVNIIDSKLLTFSKISEQQL